MMERFRRWIDGQIEADARGENPIAILRRYHSVPISKLLNGGVIIVNALFAWRYGLGQGEVLALGYLVGCLIAFASFRTIHLLGDLDTLLFVPGFLTFAGTCFLLGIGGEVLRVSVTIVLLVTLGLLLVRALSGRGGDC